MNFSSTPAPILKQLRRCELCRATRICEQMPHTAIPCACGGDMLASPVTVDDLLAASVREKESLAWLPGPPLSPGFYFHRSTFAPEPTVMRVTDDGFDRLRASGLDGVVLTGLQAGEWAGPLAVPA